MNYSIKENRRAEKSAEFLELGYNSFTRWNDPDSGLSLLCDACDPEVYGHPNGNTYNAVRLQLNRVKSEGFLESDFKIPDELDDFLKMYSKKHQ